MNPIKKLTNLGLSKYRIAKLVGVSWNTVRLWEREVFNPSKINIDRIEIIYLETKGK